ncbi:hypothetical protein BX600DRAFT_505487 [Xylariales sp. PMI_506]|nr:hypothetical protein BX600DRAFT_505487 [Xylariales sp. PMI_506]
MSVPLRKPRGIRRDRDCRSCRRRGTKCDLNRPRCFPCVQAGLACGDYPQRVVWTSEIYTAAPGPRNTPKRRRSSASSRPRSEDLAPAEAAAAAAAAAAGVSDEPAARQGDSQDVNPNSFFSRLADLCYQIAYGGARAPDSSDFLSAEAIQLISRLHEFVKTRTGRWSTAGVASDGANPSLSESVDTDSLRQAVLTHLNEALKTANPFSILGIAAFAVFEVCDAPFGDWQRHLRGARSLLDQHCWDRTGLQRLARDVTGLPDILARLVWFDTIGAIARGTTGLIFEDWHCEVLDDAFFQTTGCSADTFNLFLHVARGGLVSDPWVTCFMAMGQLLHLESEPKSWGQCANAFRYAAVIAVLTRVSEENVAQGLTRQVTLASAIDKLCLAIAAVPSSSPYLVHLGMPAYLAGIHATEAHQCDIIRSYWRRCTLAGAPRYPGGLSQCEEAWRMRGLSTAEAQ